MQGKQLEFDFMRDEQDEVVLVKSEWERIADALNMSWHKHEQILDLRSPEEKRNYPVQTSGWVAYNWV